jgi:hypothetical protein
MDGNELKFFIIKYLFIGFSMKNFVSSGVLQNNNLTLIKIKPNWWNMGTESKLDKIQWQRSTNNWYYKRISPISKANQRLLPRFLYLSRIVVDIQPFRRIRFCLKPSMTNIKHFAFRITLKMISFLRMNY